MKLKLLFCQQVIVYCRNNIIKHCYLVQHNNDLFNEIAMCSIQIGKGVVEFMRNILIGSKLNHTMPHTICIMSILSKSLYM